MEIPQEIEDFAEDIGGGYFDTRIIKHIMENGDEPYYAIHEVYYKEDGTIWAWTDNPISNTFEDKEDFGEHLRHLVEASEKPILVLEPWSKELKETDEIWTVRKENKNGRRK